MAGLRRRLGRMAQAVATIALLPFYLSEYFSPRTGREYGITFPKKVKLAVHMATNTQRIQTASNFVLHLLMATRIMNVPRETTGCIVECGAFKGGSTTNLSLVAALCERRLEVFDSFEGLPPPGAEDKSHVLVSRNELHTYDAGAFAGTLEEVRSNVTRYGAIDVCEFHKGYFEATLPDFAEPVVFVYIDVDLVSSEKTCLQYLWPLMRNDCALFTDEADHHEIASAFYDREWWEKEVGDEPPGLVGAGNGLGVFPAAGGSRSTVGYTVKRPSREAMLVKPQVTD
jgi:hypothetical protein